jgi:uroporphyrinogen decarboxylase
MNGEQLNQWKGSNMDFQPDYRNIVDVANNRKPKRLPLYEHFINVESMAQILDVEFPDEASDDPADIRELMRMQCEFFRQMTYDTVSFERGSRRNLPGGGALQGEFPGPIQNRDDFEKYPWDELPELYWKWADQYFTAMREVMPDGMKIIGGIGNGPFELSEDLVGYQELCLMQYDDPELFSELFDRIGEFLCRLWTQLLEKYGDIIAVARIGDDMGYKTQTLLAPQTLIDNVVPQYKKVISIIHSAGKPMLLHSCGKVFDIMPSMIAAGIDAKHSNEDAIAPYEQWIETYGDKIGMFGGIDTDRLCRYSPDEIYDFVCENVPRYREMANGYAVGSGNSIPPYVPPQCYLAMVRAVQDIRKKEAGGL